MSKGASDGHLMIAVGASAGGLAEIVKIVESLPEWFGGTLLIATHRNPQFPNSLAKVLANRARVMVDEPVDEESVEFTTVYVGSPAESVEVDGEQFNVEEDTSRMARMRRIDDLFISVAESAGPKAVGVILSGMLQDGVVGLRAIHEAGGTCLVQNPDEAAYDSMPEKALDAVPVAYVGTTAELCGAIMELAVEHQNSSN